MCRHNENLSLSYFALLIAFVDITKSVSPFKETLFARMILILLFVSYIVDEYSQKNDNALYYILPEGIDIHQVQPVV